MSKNLIRTAIAETFAEMAQALETGAIAKSVRVGLTVAGSEHGPRELVRGAEMARQQDPNVQVVIIGSGIETHFETVTALDEGEAHAVMDEMLLNHSLDAAVTMHYNFPIGVSTVGQVITPAKGQAMFVAATTGTAATERVTAMLKNTIFGLAVAKACGNPRPTTGILNLDGARQVERALKKLKARGYQIDFAESARTDGGLVMRGNDLLLGVPDIMVTDSLTGNVCMKVFSAYSTGGTYEAAGSGYGPGVGEDYDRIICIVSRASGAPVIAGAITFAAKCAKGNLPAKAQAEFAAAKKAGWADVVTALGANTLLTRPDTEQAAAAPLQKPVADSIPGVEVMQLEDAVWVLGKAGIYAECGMGCTGPIVMVAPEDKERALTLLKEKEYL